MLVGINVIICSDSDIDETLNCFSNIIEELDIKAHS